MYTVFTRIVAAATINFALSSVRLLFDVRLLNTVHVSILSMHGITIIIIIIIIIIIDLKNTRQRCILIILNCVIVNKLI